jgi:hypothetical protein
VAENHHPRMIDVEGLHRVVREFCAKCLTLDPRAHANSLRKIKPFVQAWYGTWHENMFDHRVNSRTWELRGQPANIGSGYKKPASG